MLASIPVSVCIPTYNGVAYLRECLDSVLAQTFDDFEILVVDDGSTDESVSIVEEYMRSDKRVRLFINKKNLGLVGNWNRCVNLAAGEWIKFVFQDDTIAPSCISRMLEASRPGVDLVVVRRNIIFAGDTSDSVKKIYVQYASEHDLAKHFSDCSYIPPADFATLMIRVPDCNAIGEPTATMVRKTAFGQFGYFNADLLSLCDWEYFARVAVNTGLCYVNEPLASFRIHARARSAELRQNWLYAISTIDSLIIQHDMAYFEPYSLLRVVAANQSPPINLKYRLAEAVRGARWDGIKMHDDGKAMAELRRTLKAYPKMLMLPLGYITNLAWQKLRGRRGRARQINR